MSRFRFTPKNALLAMTLAAAWCAAFAAHGRIWGDYGGERLLIPSYYGLIAGLPATTVATLFGHWRLGIACGVASALAVLALELLSTPWIT